MTFPSSLDIHSDEWKRLTKYAYDQVVDDFLACSKAESERIEKWRAAQPPLTRRQKFRRTRYRVYAKVRSGREWLASKVAGYDVTERDY